MKFDKPVLRKNRLLSIAILLITLSSCFLTVKGTNKRDVFLEEPKVLFDKHPKYLFNDASTEKTSVTYEYRTIVKKITPIKEKYDVVNTYVFPYNNTIVVYVYNLNNDVKNAIDQVNTNENVHIIYRNSRVTAQELKDWKALIGSNSEKLKAHGITLGARAITINGTITVGIRDITQKKVDTFEIILGEKVPMGVLVFYNETGTYSGYLDQDDHHGTMKGGLQIKSYSEEADAWVYQTMGPYVTWYDGGWKEGILTSGHGCSDDSTNKKKIYQPSKASSSYHVADFIKWASTTNPTADAALCELKGNEDGRPRIWKASGWTKNVYGELDNDDLSVNDYVECTGITSGAQEAQIEALDLDIPYFEYPYSDGIDNLIQVSPDWGAGDSGAPVYIKYPDQQSQEYMIYISGIVTGGASSGGTPLYDFYSRVENIESKLGENLDFATDR